MEDVQNALDVFIEEAQAFPAEEAKAVENTAADLARYHYEPVLLESVPNFTMLGREKLLSELAKLKVRVREGSDDQALTMIAKQASLLMYHYRLLIRLRGNDPEAWDEISALYEDD